MSYKVNVNINYQNLNSDIIGDSIDNNKSVDTDNIEDISSINGNITISKNNKASISTVNGNIKVKESNTGLNSTVNGNISIGENNYGSLSTVNGNITIGDKNLGIISTILGKIIIKDLKIIIQKFGIEEYKVSINNVIIDYYSQKVISGEDQKLSITKKGTSFLELEYGENIIIIHKDNVIVSGK